MYPRLFSFLAAAILIGAFTTDVSAAPPATAPATQPVSIHDSIARGVAYLVKSQNPDGSWGTGTETRGTEIYSMVPGSLDSFRLGASALCVMALRETGEKTAHDKGLHYLLTASDAKRDDGALLYNTWAHIYVLQAMAEEMLNGNTDPHVAEVARRNLKEMIEYATYMGGWNYYDFNQHTQSPSMGPTSFGTSAGLVALFEAKQAGLDIPDKLIKQALHRLELMRLPNGAFLYGSDYQYIPTLRANRPRGSVGRVQPANYALWLWKSKETDHGRIIEGLDLFFKEHKFLDMGRKRPYPHEAWYQTSGYYYYFDHYYASRLLDSLEKGTVRWDYAKGIASHVLPHQEEDGSWWDYAMWDFHKPYGTAFAIMTLLRCEGPMIAVDPNVKKVVFICDAGAMIAEVDQELRETVAGLSANQSFNAFFLHDGTIDPYSSSLVKATPENKTRFSLGLVGLSGGTSLPAHAFEEAFKLHPERIYLLSEGLGSGEEEKKVMETIARLNVGHRVQIDTIFLTPDLDAGHNDPTEEAPLMRIARENGGNFKWWATHRWYK